ncbi:trypsin-like serine protease [Saccharothrix longispora]|uniref:Secreted trypsin-like serine protease n=1 Tax=Saccharothrix longispora TaxID=33920 RepID=A0ABU1Q0M3_9PSEU|nr:serine protease [Saccharothrix longispora]MDR6596068.1 secreted trypsin-like serine protease [Saccharothrix longispora]
MIYEEGPMRLAALMVTLLMALAGTASADDRVVDDRMADDRVADDRVVGGERVSIEDHPWVVYLTDASGFQFCGGTLVTPTKVVTAAHCAVGRTTRNTRVVVGRGDKNSDEGEVVRLASRPWVHPDYVAADRGDDIAVLTLRDAVDQEPLPPAGPEDGELYAEGSRARVLGWGRTGEQAPASRYLLAATVPVMSDEDCSAAYFQYDEATMTCAGYPEGGVDTCQGDSGGPMVAGGKLIGVTSWGEGCAREGKPGVYSRVAAYHDVLREQLDS